MYKPIIEEIARRRIDLGLNRTQLSIKAGLPKNALLRIETGESRLTHKLRAKEIAKALGCKVTDVFEKD